MSLDPSPRDSSADPAAGWEIEQLIDELADRWKPARVVEPSGRDPHRDRWADAVSRAAKTIPELSAVDF